MKEKIKKYLKNGNFVMLITNYKIIKFKYELNSNVNEKPLIVFIFKGKKYIIFEVLSLLPLLTRNISEDLLLLILL